MKIASKITAVQWLEMEFVKLEKKFGILGEIYQLCEQAKEMEEEQIAKAFDCGYSNGEGGYQDNPIFHGCNYYDETFNNED